MNPVLQRCPVCASALTVTRLECRACGTAVEGRFSPGPFAALTKEQLDFVETFVRCEGKFTRMEGEMGLSYPTLRSRLYDVIRALGYEPGGEEPARPPSATDRRQVLEQLEAGNLDADEAVRILRGDSTLGEATGGASSESGPAVAGSDA